MILDFINVWLGRTRAWGSSPSEESKPRICGDRKAKENRAHIALEEGCLIRGDFALENNDGRGDQEGNRAKWKETCIGDVWSTNGQHDY